MQRATDPEGLAAQNAEAYARYYHNPNSNAKAKKKANEDEVKASKKYYCKVCDIACSRPSQLVRHRTTARHKDMVAQAAAGIVKRFRCKVCKYGTNLRGDMERHMLKDRHRAKVAKAESSST